MEAVEKQQTATTNQQKGTSKQTNPWHVDHQNKGGDTTTISQRPSDGKESDMTSVSNRLPSNKVISRVSYPHGLSFPQNNSRYLFL